MITPEFRGGHEVTRTIRVENAEIGDAVVLRIRDVEVTSLATSTGSMRERTEAFGDDPFVDHRCPECGTEWPESIVEGTGEESIRCAECGANVSSFGFEYGYIVAFDEDRTVGSRWTRKPLTTSRRTPTS
jgi:formamidase